VLSPDAEAASISARAPARQGACPVGCLATSSLECCQNKLTRPISHRSTTKSLVYSLVDYRSPYKVRAKSLRFDSTPQSTNRRQSQQMQHFLAHQQQYPGEWGQGHHQQPQHHVAQHAQHSAQTAQQLQAQHHAALQQAQQAQQRNYQQIAINNGTTLPGNNAVPRGPATDAQAADVGMTEENRRVLEWIAQLMKPATREAALLELSKKREQVPELALILWHSFGMRIAKLAVIYY
jgi:hypothetical protein